MRNKSWLHRIESVRVNASLQAQRPTSAARARRSHAELNDWTALDAGDLAELGRECAVLTQPLPAVQCDGQVLRHGPPPWGTHR